MEVVSPNDRCADVEEEVAGWLGAGTRVVVVVNPRGRSATVRLPEGEVGIPCGDEILDGGEAVPGWTLPVSDLFG